MINFDTLDFFLFSSAWKCFEEAIAEVATQAAQEQALVELLDKVKGMWEGLELIVLPYKDFKDVYVLGGLDEIITNLDEVPYSTQNGKESCTLLEK